MYTYVCMYVVMYVESGILSDLLCFLLDVFSYVGVTVMFSQSTYRGNEEDGSVQPQLVLSQPVSTSVTVRVSSSDRSATGNIYI